MQLFLLKGGGGSRRNRAGGRRRMKENWFQKVKTRGSRFKAHPLKSKGLLGREPHLAGCSGERKGSL